MGVYYTHIILYVGDQERSRIFYQGVLQQEPRLDVPGMTEFDLCGSCVLGLMPSNGIKRLLGDTIRHPDLADGIPRAELFIGVADAASYHQRALEHGGTELSPLQKRNWGDTVAYSLDPDGHVLAFAER